MEDSIVCTVIIYLSCSLYSRFHGYLQHRATTLKVVSDECPPTIQVSCLSLTQGDATNRGGGASDVINNNYHFPTEPCMCVCVCVCVCVLVSDTVVYLQGIVRQKKY